MISPTGSFDPASTGLMPELVPGSSTVQTCPICQTPVDVADHEPLAEITCAECGTLTKVRSTLDHFELLAVAGRGGMGVVYKALDTRLDRQVALKLLRKDHSGNEALIAQLETEAAVTASINHPNVVKVFTTGTDRGRFYLAMELVEKGSLDDLMQLQGRVAEAQVLQVGIQIAQGLRAACEHGLIHRDVKPGNILFADAHTAKIVDFGLAVFMEQEESVRGEIWGTPYYVAPEKLDNKPEDFRSDIYSLGGTLFHALAGRPPFEAENASLVALKHLKAQPVSLQAFAPHVSGPTAYVINRTLLKDPAQRYQSYDDLIEHLEYARNELSAAVAKPPAKRVVVEDETDKRAWGWVAAGTILLALLLGIGSLFALRNKRASDAAVTASATPVANAAATVAEDRTPMASARRKLIDGETHAAATAFGEIAAASKIAPAERKWAQLQQGLAELLAEEPAKARATFGKIAAAGPFSKGAADAKLAEFFVTTATTLSSEAAPPPAADRLSRTNHEAIALLLYGIWSWQLGRIEEAVGLLREFRRAQPVGADAWIAQLKPLASRMLEEAAEFNMKADLLRTAPRMEQKAAAAKVLRKAKGPLAVRATELLKEYEQSLTAYEKTRSTPSPASGKIGEWSYGDVGRTGLAGSAALDAGQSVFTINAAGADIWLAADAFHFAHQKVSGDFELTAQVRSLEAVHEWAKAGLMVRENLNANSRNVFVTMAAGKRAAQQVRPEPGAVTTSVKVEAVPLPRWLRVVRRGTTLSGFHSPDGKAWTPLGEDTVNAMPAEVFVGLAVTSHLEGTLTTATFEDVQLVRAQQ